MNAENSEKICSQVQKLIESNPDIVIKTILDGSFWLSSIESRAVYSRSGDDDDGVISVMFGPDGDAWIKVISEPDPKELGMDHRFRSYFGGGQSLRTRNALLILAQAIALDNEENPQTLKPSA